MSAVRRPAGRWALSFADLSLVLLAFFVLLQAQRDDPLRLAGGVRAAFGNHAEPVDAQMIAAAPLFEPGEAVLRPEARARFAAIGRAAAAQGRDVRVASIGAEPASARFDGWELAAARVASVARAVAAGGLDPARIDVSIPATMTSRNGGAQQIGITLVTPRR